MKYYAGMDIGGTFARVRVVTETGTLLGERKVRGCTFNTSGFEKARDIYQQAVKTVLEEWNLAVRDCHGFCAAVSGVDTKQQAVDCKKIFVKMGFPAHRVWVYNDCEIILELTDLPSVVLVAGTGSIAFGKNSAGETVRCGGWGHILSDEGSGMDMGKRVLRAVGDHMDGRKSCPVLYQLFEKRSSIRSVDELDNYMNTYIMDKPKIADFAVLAQEAFAKGDRESEKILMDCAEALFELVRDTYKKVEKAGEAPKKLFLWGGMVANNPIVARRVEEMVRETFPEMEILRPEIEVAKMAVLRAGAREL